MMTLAAAVEPADDSAVMVSKMYMDKNIYQSLCVGEAAEVVVVVVVVVAAVVVAAVVVVVVVVVAVVD